MGMYLILAVIGFVIIVIQFNIKMSNGSINKNSPTAVVVNSPESIQQDDGWWPVLVIFGLVGLLFYMYLLSPELFDIF